MSKKQVFLKQARTYLAVATSMQMDGDEYMMRYYLRLAREQVELYKTFVDHEKTATLEMENIINKEAA